MPLSSPETRVWLHFFDSVDELTRNRIEQSLAQLRIRMDPYELDEAHSGPGIVFFKLLDPELYSFIRESSRNGAERVLAVAISAFILQQDGPWLLLQAGASDVFAWDDSIDSASVVVAHLERWRAVDDLLYSSSVQNNLIGSSPAWITLLRQIIHVAHFTNANIALMGETGTGKELVARLIHSLDSRTDNRELVVLDCTTIVPELSGSEFFGHERGAFTGAVASRDGAFALADGGTLFLDEVGELPLQLQAQLLRAVQEHTYKRVGSNTWRETRFRLVSATNKDLLKEVEQGRFRHDLYYRIANWTFTLPSLRQRIEDVIPLVRHFMRQFQTESIPLELDPSVREFFLTRDYPGNVRDLKQLVYRITLRHVGIGPITVGDIPEDERPTEEQRSADWVDPAFEDSIRRALVLGVGLRQIRRAAEETAIRIAVKNENGNLQRAAKKLDVTDRVLQLWRAARRHRASSDAEPLK